MTEIKIQSVEELLSFINCEHLEKLRDLFKQHPDSLITKEQFVVIINELQELEGELNDLVIDLFDEIDVDDCRRISWDQFLDFNIKFLEPRPKQLLEFGQISYSAPPHVKRDAIVKIVLVETKDNFCYVIVGKYGRVGVYNGNMDFLTSYSVLMTKEDATKNGDNESRKRYRWITDAAFMSDVLMLVYVNSARSMSVYDVMGLKHVPLWVITGFPEVVHCLAYITSKNEQKRKLCLGMENGQVLLMIFQKPYNREELFRRTNDKITFFFYKELIDQVDYVKIKNLGYFHKENHPRRISTIKNDSLLITCSSDPRNSITVRDLRFKPDTKYTFSMKRGANCFSVSEKLKILITGSEDGKIRLWNLLVSSPKPVETIKLHKCGILDLIFHETLDLLLSCSRDAVLKLCDLKHSHCLQTVSLKFPSFNILGSTLENIQWSRQVFYPGPKKSVHEECESAWDRDNLLITCCNYIASAKLYFFDGKDRYEEDVAPVLPPPPVQNNFLIPRDWQMPIVEKRALRNGENIEISIDRFGDLDFILEKDLKSLGMSETDINERLAALEEKKLKMKWAVERGAPYLALDLYQVEEMVLPVHLPVATTRRGKTIAEKARKLLEEASNRSRVFSDISSSKSSISSRTSLTNFR